MNNALQAVFTVDAKEAGRFAQMWTYNGLAVPVGPEHLQFATDFANIALKNFLLMVQNRTRAATTPVQTIEQKADPIIERHYLDGVR